MTPNVSGRSKSGPVNGGVKGLWLLMSVDYTRASNINLERFNCSPLSSFPSSLGTPPTNFVDEVPGTTDPPPSGGGSSTAEAPTTGLVEATNPSTNIITTSPGNLVEGAPSSPDPLGLPESGTGATVSIAAPADGGWFGAGSPTGLDPQSGSERALFGPRSPRRVSVASSEDVGELASAHGFDPNTDRWIRFITVVPGEHGRFKIKADSMPVYGGFSDVWQCDARFYDGKIITVAVKKFRTVRIPRDADASATTNKLLKRLTKELDIWMSLQHPNITPLIGFVLRDDMCMISPWYPNGNVGEYIIQHPEVDRIKLVSDVACGLAYLHNLASPVVHGDMKPDNVLIDESGDAHIIDFGLSSVLETEAPLATSFTTASLQDSGNIRWMAPELVMEEGCTRSPSTDVYSLGSVALYIYTGEIPFKRIPTIQIIYALVRGQTPLGEREDYPALWAPGLEWFRDLLVVCWDLKPEIRPSMTNLEERIKSRGM